MVFSIWEVLSCKGKLFLHKTVNLINNQNVSELYNDTGKAKMDNSANINKDLILREKLAIERTAMAIDTTLLSFIRTSLYFAVAGLTVNSFLKMQVVDR